MRMPVSIAPASPRGRPASQALVYDARMQVTHPVVRVSTRGADRIRSGHPWVYRSDIRDANAEPGDLVQVESERGRPLGLAFWSGASQISLRFLGVGPVDDERAFLLGRLRAAVAYRDSLAIDATAFRAVNAEADRLPGLIVDVYGAPPDRVVVVQTLTQAMDRRLSMLGDLLVEVLSPTGVLARNDPRVRRLEGLPEQVVVVRGEVPETVDVREGPLTLTVNLREGQKTGLFLDQRENHAAAAGYARGRALDAFAYHGGFGLRLAPHCDSVLALDSSEPAIRQIRADAARNGLANVEAREVNVFDELREREIARDRFETIVLDPPAFARNKASVDRAAAGYKEINLRALKLLAPGGILATCSCSYNIDESMFEAILESAAADAQATVVVVERRTQARDHPVLLAVPETHYLKCFVLRKLP
jgi:23S rRNA (cytosine1962-C5)-methyltransferase